MATVPCKLAPSPLTTIPVVVASQFDQERRDLNRIGAISGLRMYEAGSSREAIVLASLHQVSVVICERDLPGGGWKSVLAGLAGLPRCPQLIVSSRLADHHLWADVLELGGYDVLITPFDAKEVSRVVSSACASAKREQRVQVRVSATAG